jgi:hypothetical protein
MEAKHSEGGGRVMLGEVIGAKFGEDVVSSKLMRGS